MLVAKPCIAQSDSTSNTINKEAGKSLFQPDPKKAGMYSSILPGLGQAYNRQYWKIPVIYAGIGVAGFFIYDNVTKYRSFREAYVLKLDSNPNNDPTDDRSVYTTSQLKDLQEFHRKYAEMTVLLTALGYTIQILDAVASAHLMNFDISPDITMRFQPVILNNAAGVGLVVNF